MNKRQRRKIVKQLYIAFVTRKVYRLANWKINRAINEYAAKPLKTLGIN